MHGALSNIVLIKKILISIKESNMSYTMTISADFKPALIPGWYIFNTWLQKQIDTNIYIEMASDFNDLSKVIDNNSIDLIYANPCDIAKPVGIHDETVIIYA